MPDNTEPTPVVTPEPTTTQEPATTPDPALTASPPNETPAPVVTPEPEVKDPPPSPEPKTVTLTSHVYGENLQKEREKGKRAAQREIEEKLKAKGYDNLDSILAALDAKPAAPTTPEPQTKEPAMPDPTPPVTPTVTPPEDLVSKTKEEREVVRLAREKAEAEQKLAQAEAARKNAEHQRLAAEARHKLEKAAMAAGVKDLDYATHLFEQSMRGKSDEEISKTDEKAFFEGLKKDKPYIFGEVTVPANTGTGPGNAPGAPGPGDVTRNTGDASQFDARKATRAEMDARLKKIGLGPNAMLNIVPR